MSFADMSNGRTRSPRKSVPTSSSSSQQSSSILPPDAAELSGLVHALKLKLTSPSGSPICEQELYLLKDTAERFAAQFDARKILKELKKVVQRKSVLQLLLRPVKVVIPTESRSNVDDADDTDKDGNNTSSRSLNPASFAGAACSVLKILLSVSTLQKGLINLLLEIIPGLQYDNDNNTNAADAELSQENATNGDGDNNNNSSSNNNSAVNYPKLVLSQFRWIDFTMDFEHLTAKLHEVVDACGPDARRDIISLLPEVVPDAAKKPIVEKLLSLMTDDSAMTTAVLEALGNISIG